MVPPRVLIGIPILLTLLLLSGCADTSTGLPEKPVLFPKTVEASAAAQQPRIQFLKAFSYNTDLEPPRSGFWEGVTGEQMRQTAIIKPYGVATLPGMILVCDPKSRRVQVLDLKNRKLTSFGAEQLAAPFGITVDRATDTLFVSDRDTGKILIYGTDLTYRRQLVRTPPPLPDEDPAAPAPKTRARMRPFGMAVIGKSLYVCDLRDHEIKVFDTTSGKLINRFGRSKNAMETLHWPVNIAVGQKGRLYVTDTYGAATPVQIFAPDGKKVGTLGTPGEKHGTFARPKGIAVDRNGITFIVDSRPAEQNVQIFTPDKELLMYFPAVPGDHHPGGLNMPAGITIDYDNLSYFESYVAEGFRLEALVIVTSQFGRSKVSVYGLIRPDGATGSLFPPSEPAPATEVPPTEPAPGTPTPPE